MKTLLFLFILFPLVAFAGAGTSKLKISRIYVSADWTMVQLSSSTVNPDGCKNTSYYAVDQSYKNYEVLHSTLLAAYMADKEVSFWVAGCGGQHGNHPKIISITSF